MNETQTQVISSSCFLNFRSAIDNDPTKRDKMDGWMDYRKMYHNFSGASNVNLRFEDQLRSSYTLSNQSYDIVGTDVKNYKENSGNNLEQKTRNRKDIKGKTKEKASHGMIVANNFPRLMIYSRDYTLRNINVNEMHICSCKIMPMQENIHLQENAAARGESKIPILSTRERTKKAIVQNLEQSVNPEYVDSNSQRRQTKDALDNNKNRINPQQENVG